MTIKGRRLGRAVFLAIFVLSMSRAGNAKESNGLSKVDSERRLLSQSFFEPNEGQVDKKALFLVGGLAYSAFFTNDGLWMSLDDPGYARKSSATVRRHLVKLTIVGEDPRVEVIGADRLPAKSNYFGGSDPNSWHVGVPHFAKVLYRDVYPGIDLVFYFREGQLEFDFVLAPGANPNIIRLKVDGADLLRRPGGDISLYVADNALGTLKQPIAFEPGAEHRRVESQYAVRGDQITLSVGLHNHTHPLVIDPALIFSTYLYSSCPQDESPTPQCTTTVSDMAVDDTGVYLTGQTNATGFPAPGGSSVQGANRAFVVKLDPTGSKILYDTFLDDSNAVSVAVDSSGAAYVSGSASFPAPSSGAGFPTTAGAFSPAVSGGCSQNPTGCIVPFAAKLSPDGSALQYSTLLQFFASSGQSASELIQPASVTVDADGALYITGTVLGWASLPLPGPLPLMPLPVTVGAYQTTRQAGGSLFALKVNPNGSGLTYSTYLGGTQLEQTAAGIAVDSSLSAYIAGNATSGYPTTPGAYQVSGPGSGFSAGIITKLSAGGSSLVYSTYLGGAGNDKISGINVDSAGQVAVVGWGFPTGSSGTTCQNNSNASIAKFDPTGSSLLYSNVYCGLSAFMSVATDGSDAAYVVGYTSNPAAFPILNPIQGYNPNPNGYPGVVAKFSTSGALAWSTFFGDLGNASGASIAVDTTGSAYILGLGNPPITPNALQPEPFAGSAPFLAKIAPSLGDPVPVVSPTTVAFGSQLVGTSGASVDVSVGNFGDAPISAAIISVTGDFSQTNTCSNSVPGGQKCDISVAFAPTSAGNLTGTLTVSFGGSLTEQTAALSGTGTVAAAAPTPSQLTFPAQAVGTTSTSQQVVINNLGTASLTISSAQTSGDFAETNTCGAPVAPGSSCTLQITFTPSAAGTRTGVLTLVDNAPDSPQTVALTGVGSNAVVSLAPSSLTFAAQVVGTSSATQQVVISNSGSGSLAIASLQTTGDFSETNGCTTMIAPGGNCSVLITFTPTAIGLRAGALTIADNAQVRRRRFRSQERAQAFPCKWRLAAQTPRP